MGKNTDSLSSLRIRAACECFKSMKLLTKGKNQTKPSPTRLAELLLLPCSLPAAQAELLQHSPEPALWKGLLGLNNLLHVIQTLLLLENRGKSLDLRVR